jgi:membrane protein DedA with SNARE-associated domain
MHEIIKLIQQHGDAFYLITFLWTALEGETFVIFAGLAAQKGLINFGLLFLAAWLGTFCGDQIFFLTGRKFGVHILEKIPKLKAPVESALGWLERHAVAFILAYRFMYGVRNVSGVAIGMSHLSWRKFMLWNGVAAFIWAAIFAGFGYLYGDVLSRIRHKTQVVEDSVRGMMLAILGLFTVIVLFRLGILWYQRHRRACCAKRLIEQRQVIDLH